MNQRKRWASPIRMLLWMLGCCCIVASSCSTQKQQLSPEQASNLKEQLSRIEITNRSSHRNPHVIEILNAQNKVATAFASAKTPEERDLEARLYERFSRQLQLQQLVIQQRPSPGPPRQSKVSNGKSARPGQIPYQAALISTGYSSPLYGQYCGATVLDPNWVLTAGHCVGGAKPGAAGSMCLDSAILQPGDIQVFVGSTQLSNGGVLAEVDSYCVNPDYMSVGLHQDNDIALIKLRTPVSVQVLPNLAGESTQTKLLAFTHNATISGWGQTGSGTNGTDALQYGTVEVLYPNANCQISYPSDMISSAMICATSTVADTCYGDSGGPLIMRTMNNLEYVEGVTSWAEGQCGQGIPSVYTRFPKFASWVHAVTGVVVSP